MNIPADKTTGSETENPHSSKPCCCEELKQSVADKLRQAADALAKTATEHGENSDLADFEKQAAQWLNQSSDYIRQFDYEREQANVRNHIARNPGRSLAIAGAAGLLIGMLTRK